jgi:hypothetical protein
VKEVQSTRTVNSLVFHTNPAGDFGLAGISDISMAMSVTVCDGWLLRCQPRSVAGEGGGTALCTVTDVSIGSGAAGEFQHRWRQLEICDAYFKKILFLRSFGIENREKGWSEA